MFHYLCCLSPLLHASLIMNTHIGTTVIHSLLITHASLPLPMPIWLPSDKRQLSYLFLKFLHFVFLLEARTSVCHARRSIRSEGFQLSTRMHRISLHIKVFNTLECHVVFPFPFSWSFSRSNSSNCCSMSLASRSNLNLSNQVKGEINVMIVSRILWCWWFWAWN